MAKTAAYLLVFHGSRDQRPEKAVSQLAELVAENLTIMGENSPLVATASLELATIPLHESIRQVALEAAKMGKQYLKILPLFLLPGVHVQEDIPAEVVLAVQSLGTQIKLELLPYLGSHGGITHLLAQQFSLLPSTEGKILLAHGSRYPNANLPIEKLAFQLQTLAVYWSVSPSLTEKVTSLAASGTKKIAIVPYFLFQGGIIEAIAAQVTELQSSFPQTQLFLGQPLGATTELANLVTSMLTISH